MRDTLLGRGLAEAAGELPLPEGDVVSASASQPADPDDTPSRATKHSLASLHRILAPIALFRAFSARLIGGTLRTPPTPARRLLAAGTFSVLVVDDEPNIHLMLTALIGTEDSLVGLSSAMSGDEAVRLALHERPDIVICDLNMPGMDGLETVSRLRDICPEAVIALYSADPEARRGLELGADVVFDKGDDPTTMLTELLRQARERS